jgi:hypothetical protein
MDGTLGMATAVGAALLVLAALIHAPSDQHTGAMAQQGRVVALSTNPTGD